MATVNKKCTVTEYLLRLNQEEASVLFSILQKIGGDATKYPRRVSENIGEALRDAGVEAVELKTQPGRDGIYFV